MFVFPYYRSYLEAGDFTVKGKLFRSLKRNGPFYILYLVIVLATVGILSSYELGREALQTQGTAGCLMTLNMVVGLISIILVLGYGIAGLPKRFFTLSSHSYLLEQDLFKIATLESDMIVQDAHIRNLIAQAFDLVVPAHLLAYHSEIKENCTRFKRTELYRNVIEK
jgi:hypothetical protein